MIVIARSCKRRGNPETFRWHLDCFPPRLRLAVAMTMVLGISCTSKPKPDSHITYEFNQKISELVVRVKLPEGMHAYAPGEPVGRPIELVIDPKNNWQLASPPSLPMGDAKHLLNQSFEIKAKLKNGRGPIFGVFKMQLCSDNSCERPQDYAFKVSL